MFICFKLPFKKNQSTFLACNYLFKIMYKLYNEKLQFIV